MKKSNNPLVTLNTLLVFGAMAINAHAGNDVFGTERSKQYMREMFDTKIILAPIHDNNTPGTQKNFPGKNEGAFKGLEQDSSPSPTPYRPVSGPSPIPYRPDPKAQQELIDLVNKMNNLGDNRPTGSGRSEDAPGSNKLYPT